MRLSGGNRSRTLHFQAVCLQSWAPSSHCRLKSPGKWRQHQCQPPLTKWIPTTLVRKRSLCFATAFSSTGWLKGQRDENLTSPQSPSMWEGPSQPLEALESPLHPKPTSLTDTGSNRWHTLHTCDCNPALGRQRQGYKFEGCLGYIRRLCQTLAIPFSTQEQYIFLSHLKQKVKMRSRISSIT